jgi:8-oxo-dGTP pyrophosphatase MutT (NUDIX family)
VSVLPAAEWFASLATMYGTAAALIMSESGDVLLVKPNYRPLWSLPGGVLEEGEAPHTGCAREVREELGLDLAPGPLLAVSWVAPDGDRPRPLVGFVFDGGTLDAGADIVLQESELDEWRFVPVAELDSYLPDHMAERVRAAVHARENGHGGVYLHS